MRLPDTGWRARDGLAALLAALGADGGETRFVGGYVRDALLGLPAHDIDLATRLAPDAVIARVRDAGFKPVPTGLAHGTVTAVLPSGPIEVTTLRRDVATDGRHATVAFTQDWQADAARRDFTINALLADPHDGTVIDFFGGLDDLAARRLRFIGDPRARIAEDHLRILRFFRFHARFGQHAPDPAGLAACTARANDLMALSRERIADELLKLLAVADPVPTIALMIRHGILAPVLPEIGGEATRLARLVAAEAAFGVAPDAVRRLAALLPDDPEIADAVAARLKLSNAIRKRLATANAGERVDHAQVCQLAHRIGAPAVTDRLLLSDEDRTATGTAIAQLAGWQRPVLPVRGRDLLALGLSAGPAVARALAAIERQWSAEGFPDATRAHAIARAAVDRERAQALAARQ